ncbi:phosphotransferase [Candidatus Bathyarchaeota archaeon]|nr:phosphotransferase [Candidatus Bathyarchaeota archaeon]
MLRGQSIEEQATSWSMPVAMLGKHGKAVNMIERVGSLYSLGSLRIVKRLDAGNFNDSFLVSDDKNEKYVVRTSEGPIPELEGSLAIQDIVFKSGCSVVGPRMSANNRYSELLEDTNGGKMAVSVIDYKEGVTHDIIEENSISIKTFFSIGYHLAKLHTAFSEIDIDDTNLNKWFERGNCFNCLNEEHKGLEKDSYFASKYLEYQEMCKKKYGDDRIIHCDIHFDNILISGSSVYFCDFDDVCLGDHRMDIALLLFDLAIINDPAGDWATINHYATSIIDGYNGESKTSKVAISDLLDCFRLLELSFFILYGEQDINDLRDGWVRRYLLNRKEMIVNDQPFWRA